MSPEQRAERDKRAVAESFSRAAATYDSVAALQRQVGDQLLAHLQTCDLPPPARLVDLGCGTGYFTARLADAYAGAAITGLDLAEGMLRFARQQRALPAVRWLAGDMEALPFAPASLDAAFTSLALQWCEDLPVFFAGLSRALSPGGWAAICTLGPGTLTELRQSWARVDDYVHVNRFAPSTVLRAAAREAGLRERLWAEQTLTLHYPGVRELTRELKALGAHNVNHSRAQGLTGPGRVRRFAEAYEQFRTPQGLPASYEVYWLLVCNEPA